MYLEILSLIGYFFVLRGVIKRQVNLELHSPGCKLTKSNNISGNNSNVTWCSEDPVFKADEAQVFLSG